MSLTCQQGRCDFHLPGDYWRLQVLHLRLRPVQDDAGPGRCLQIRSRRRRRAQGRRGRRFGKLLLSASQTDSRLSETPTVLHYAASGSAARLSRPRLDREHPRGAQKPFGNDIHPERRRFSSSPEYMIRVQDPGNDPDFSKTVVILSLTSELGKAFGSDNVLVKKSNFVGAPQFSKSLQNQALFAVFAAFVGILIYCALRFKPNFALGAVLSVVHDALIMVAFIVITRMEFNTSSIAAILTIVGYSINDTIVIYDRIREKIKVQPRALLSART